MPIQKIERKSPELVQAEREFQGIRGLMHTSIRTGEEIPFDLLEKLKDSCAKLESLGVTSGKWCFPFVRLFP